MFNRKAGNNSFHRKKMPHNYAITTGAASRKDTSRKSLWFYSLINRCQREKKGEIRFGFHYASRTDGNQLEEGNVFCSNESVLLIKSCGGNYFPWLRGNGDVKIDRIKV